MTINFNIPKSNLHISSSIGDIRVQYRNNEFFVIKQDQVTKIESYNLPKELRNITTAQLEACLKCSYIALSKVENNYVVRLHCRGLGGGPIACAIAYWATKVVCYAGAAGVAVGAGVAVVGTGGAAAGAIGTMVSGASGAAAGVGIAGAGASVGVTGAAAGAIAEIGVASFSAGVTAGGAAVAGAGGVAGIAVAGASVAAQGTAVIASAGGVAGVAAAGVAAVESAALGVGAFFLALPIP